jgi:molybdopterin synthase sulfur carrier subunit
MATVVIPALLRKYTEGKDRVIANGRNVGQVIDDLERQYPGLREHVIEDGEVKPSVAISVDGEMSTGGVLEPVRESSEIFILPAIGGG